MSSPHTDQNLLFGVLALQANLIDAARLVEACTAWADRKNTPLADLLRERGWLTAEQRGHIDFLLQRQLHQHADKARARLAAAGGAAARELQATIDDDAVRESLAELPTPDPTLRSTVAYQPQSRARYTLTRLHATGGMGQVWLAHDAGLGREVALKELRPERAGHPAVRARFVAEARITGQLEHPGIVPVYELGQDEEGGQPFYTMRFVEGRTLRAAIREYQGRRQKGQAGPLELTGLLNAFVSVCNAVAYAHSRGVLHRDLKPDNVALGDYGEVLLLDWGMARLTRRQGSRREANEHGPKRAPVAIPSADPREATVQGQVLGTPAYMAPEQAAGQPELLGEYSDVYGLGAILYEVLSGRAPFEGTDVLAVLEAVRTKEPVPPRQRVVGVPAALEAVCLKALAKKPSERYTSAAALADDVRRYLADEPVRAYAEPMLRRLTRWGRRHRPLVAALAVLLLSVTAALAVGLVAVNTERGRTQQALEGERQAHLDEAQRRRQAREALDAMTSEVLDDLLARQKALTSQQQKFLQRALADYESFAQDTGEEEAARAGVAGAYARVGDILRRLGQSDCAAAAYHAAARRYGQLVADFPAVPAYRRDLATSHANLGILLATTGHSQEALAEWRQALAIQKSLTADFPAIAAYREALATIHHNLGLLLQNTGHGPEALAEHRQALSLRKQLAADFPTVADYRQGRARSHNAMGALLASNGQGSEAQAEYRQALALFKQLAADFPTVPEYRRELAGTHNNLGLLLSDTGHSQEAQPEYRQALAAYTRLTADFPAVPDYRQELALTHNNLGNVLSDLSRGPEAQNEYRQALAVQKQLAADFPTVPNYRRELALSHNNLGSLLYTTGHGAEARGEYLQSLPLFKQLTADFPTVPDYQNDLAGTLGNLAQLALVGHDFNGAHRWLREAWPHHQAALRANPRHPGYRTYYRNNLQALAEIQLARGEHAKAAASSDRLAAAVVEPATDLYNAACYLSRCVPLADKDTHLSEDRRQRLAARYAERAMARLKEAIAHGYKDTAQMKKDTDLDPLRQRVDFQKLLAGLLGK